jgi:hypothetical protein
MLIRRKLRYGRYCCCCETKDVEQDEEVAEGEAGQVDGVDEEAGKEGGDVGKPSAPETEAGVVHIEMPASLIGSGDV